MPHWVPTTVLLTYTSIVALISLTAVFGETVARRTAAYKVLLILLPTGVLFVGAQFAAAHIMRGA